MNGMATAPGNKPLSNTQRKKQKRMAKQMQKISGGMSPKTSILMYKGWLLAQKPKPEEG